MKKAFIAAPLLGTFILLASVAFVVNLSNTEKLASAQVVNDAYHNRLVSLLEVYRTDLASIFREGIIRTTEYFLLSQCWDQFKLTQNSVWLNSKPGGGDGFASDLAGGGKVTVEMLRFVKCDNMRTFLSQIICSIPQTVDDASYSYGLPQWMDKLRVSLPFEGMTFDVANRESMAVFIPEVGPDGKTIDVNDAKIYQDYCNALMRGSVFDCNNFARNTASPYRCCKTRTTFTSECAPEDVVPGCEDGTFFINVSVNNSMVYPAMPRFNASDGQGNQIRSGAIGESDFLLPINYPLFRYYDYAFGVFSKLAYGTPGTRDAGVADGLCKGGSACAGIDVGGGKTFGSVGYGSPDANENDAAADVESALFSRYSDACLAYSNPSLAAGATGSGLKGGLVLLESSSDAAVDNVAGYKSCVEMVDAVAGGRKPVDVLPGQMNALKGMCDQTNPSNPLWCAYYGYYANPNFLFHFEDFDPAYKVDPDKNNFFCWSASPEHDKP